MITINNNNNKNNDKSIPRNQQACFTIWRSPFQKSVWTRAKEKVMVKVKVKGNVKVKLKRNWKFYSVLRYGPCHKDVIGRGVKIPAIDADVNLNPF
jgi:hypothetical protein